METRPAGRVAGWRVPTRVVRRATTNFVEDRCTQQAAAISYYGLLSLFPLLLLAAAIFGLVLRDESLRADVLESLVNTLPIEGENVAQAVADIVDGGPTLGIFALIGVLWTASALTGALRRGIEIAFTDDTRRPLLRAKLMDYVVLPVVGVLFLTSFALSTAWGVAQSEADERLSFTEGPLQPLWETGAVAIPATLSFATFLFLYWFIPNQQVRLRHIWPGALIATLAFEGAKFGFTLYLSNFANYQLIYGSLGGVIVLLVWIYLTANITLYGAEIAAEVPHVIRGEDRHGHLGAVDRGFWSSTWAMLRGLIFAQNDEPERDPPSRPVAPRLPPSGELPPRSDAREAPFER